VGIVTPAPPRRAASPLLVTRSSSRTRAQRRRRFRAWLFVLPALIASGGIVGIPSLFTVGLSFFSWSGLGAAHFIGFQNFVQLFTDDSVFVVAVEHVLIWTVWFLTIPVALGLGSALLVSRISRGQIAYRTIFYLPVTIASVVVSKIWQWLYDPVVGVDPVLQAHHLNFLAPNWLTSTHVVLVSIMIANTWAWWGFLSVLFLVALGQIDGTLYDSAKVDGANAWRSFRFVTLPLLRPTLIFIGLLTTLWSFITFDYPYLMTQGGPAHASETLSTWMYFNLINMSQAGYAASIATTTTGFLLVVIACYVYVRIRGWEV
jgi:raffinose/stachyose/melibiose transport system permease protein